ncbi:ankyrin repeat domain-containing protein [Endozoicomonas ascidiicola]|uniref:ankyrin repeat domain-containing protein n=1 Tax=Endozoicomonas ascidiicola TaxID=1698521 RepID=UPI000829B516|nr:ankyrin repeat domain-containing protein [Endozoicomonas ascidiicola]
MSVKIPERPYLMIGEIYRGLAVALGTKNKNSDVDRMARDGDYDHRLRERLLKDLFYQPLASQTDEHFASLICEFIDFLIDEYISLVNKIALDAMTRKESLPLLVEHFFCRHTESLLSSIHRYYGGPNPVDYCKASDNNLMGVACLWLEGNVGSFSSFLTHVSTKQGKAKKDQYLRWKKGIEIPKAESITDILNDFPDSPDKTSIRIHLTVARTLQFFLQKYRQYNLQAHVAVGQNKTEPFDLGMFLSKANIQAAKKYSDLLSLFVPVSQALRRTVPKMNNSKAESWALLEAFERKTSEVDPSGITRHFLEWQKARWYVYAGQYKEALKQYKIAADYTFYRAHNLSQAHGVDLNLHEIIREAMALAAKEKSRPLMTSLKSQAITFGLYEQPKGVDPLSRANKKSNNHIIEDWEIEQWDTGFAHIFKPANCFPGCIDEEKHKIQLPFLHHVEEKYFKRAPDLTNPDRRIDVGISIGGEKRRYPQLIWHTDCNHPHHVRSLLKAGARVDQLSDTSDSALLMATIEVVNTGDRRCFDLIKQYPHKHETMNMRTDKKKLTVLLAAIETGQPEIVETILDLGAEVDRRGHTDHSTALNQCIKYIGNVKSPQQALANMLQLNPDDPVLIDAIRRNSHGMMGLTDAEVRKSLIRSVNDKTSRAFQETIAEYFHEEQQSRFEYQKLFQITKLLLERGADPDATHKSPIPGYTPLMLACELDESELVQLMIEKGGDPYKTYQHELYPIDCWDIAHYFGSKSVLAVFGHKKQ